MLNVGFCRELTLHSPSRSPRALVRWLLAGCYKAPRHADAALSPGRASALLSVGLLTRNAAPGHSADEAETGQQ
jgi:hypothetical protein